MTTNASTTLKCVYINIRDIAILLAISTGLPMLIHLIPNHNGIPWAMRLIPIFIAPLIAVIYFNKSIAFTIALTAPWVNHFLTGNPIPPIAAMLTVEMFIFVLLIKVANEISHPRAVYIPLSYILAKITTKIIFMLLPYSGIQKPILESLIQVWPGILLMFIISIISLKHFPPTQDHA